MTRHYPSLSAEIALAYRIGSSTVGANLQRAAERGDVTLHEDGSWELANHPLSAISWRFGPRPTPFACTKLFGFLFRNAYDRGAVPVGCRNCFKVQIRPRTLRELNATLPIAEAAAHPYKAGAGLAARYQSGPYSALFYFDGLDQARASYADLRRAVDADPLLGPDVPMAIKRGCTEYEIHCGPSDRFTFAPELETVENALLDRLRPPAAPVLPNPRAVFMYWLKVAFQVGDETYRDFTGGRPLYRAAVTYASTTSEEN